MTNSIKLPLLIVGLIYLSACTQNQNPLVKSPEPDSSPQPDNSPVLVASSESSKVQTSVGMVVTANPHSTRAGAEILRAGGSAVDAAIAIQAVLSLVEPQSSGLGGGGFMVHFDNATNQVDVYDGRETAPKNVSADMFLDDNGESIGFFNAKLSGLSTGVPGMVAMLDLAHKDHGKLPWGGHFDNAIKLAEQGFPISERLNMWVKRVSKRIPKTLEEGTLDAFNYLYDSNGEALPIGTIRNNPDYAATLRTVANDPRKFYTDEIARSIIEQVQQTPRAGNLSLDDMSEYKALKKAALCTPISELQFCGPPPSSSWVAVGAISGLLEFMPKFTSAGAADPQNWAIFAEAQRLAYADRDFYVADNEFVDVPLAGMLNKEYLQQRASLVSSKQAQPEINPGEPWEFQTRAVADRPGKDATSDAAGTSHFVVVDADGNVVSMTASVESVFGSTRIAGGMFLNNQLTDFSFEETDDAGNKIANRIQAGKRPRSSMSPTIVLDQDGEFLMATGSPGGNSIIAYTAKTLVGVLEWNLTAQQAVDLPNMVARTEKVRIEKDRASPELIQGLRDYGYEVKESAGENSGLSVVVRLPDGRLQGGVDPRREGVIEVVEF